MKQIYVVFFAISTSILISCTEAKSNLETGGRVVTRTNMGKPFITDKHYQFPGTGVYIVPPVGFTPLADGKRLMNEQNGSSITFVTISPADYEIMLLGKDTIIPIAICDFKGQIVYYKFTECTNACELSFGNNAFVIVLTGIYAANNRGGEKEIENAFVTTLYDNAN